MNDSMEEKKGSSWVERGVVALLVGLVTLGTAQMASAQEADYSVVNDNIEGAWLSWSEAAMVTVAVAVAIGFSFWGIPVLIRTAKRIFKAAGG